MKIGFRSKLLTAGFATLAGILGSVPIVAQEGTVYSLEEIVVTARKREESLQEVPESITVLGGSFLEAANISNLDQAMSYVPNVSIAGGAAGFRAGVIQLTVRGISTPQNGEAPMAFVVDGVTAPELDFINQELVDIESIQVLRGPQGALWGRGALAGAVVINTKKPGDELEGFVKAFYGNGADARVTASVSAPIIEDTLAFSLTGYYQDRDGIIDNVTLNTTNDFAEKEIVRGRLVYTPSEDLELDLKVNVTDETIGAGRYDVVPNAIVNSVFEGTITSNILGVNDREIFETSLRAEWDLGFATLNSVTAYSDIDDLAIIDGDFSEAATEADFAGAQRNEVLIESITQELRLTSNSDQRLRWMVGAFWQQREKAFNYDFLFEDSTLLPVPTFPAEAGQQDLIDSTASAAFVNLDYDINDQLELSLALRYDQDDRDFEDPRDSASQTSAKFSEVQPKASLSYQWTDEVLLFAAYAHGFRSGGFNEILFTPATGTPLPFGKETSDSYEIGFKSSFLDSRAIVNATFFHIGFDDNQYRVFEPDTFALGIATLNEAEVDGLELEVTAQLSPSLQVNMSTGITQGEILDADGTGVNDGNFIPETPAYSFNLGAQYARDLTDDMELTVRADYKQVGRRYWEGPANQYVTGTQNYVDASLGLSMGPWLVSVYGNNLTDERAPLEVQEFFDGFALRAINEPRTYGASVRFDF